MSVSGRLAFAAESLTHEIWNHRPAPGRQDILFRMLTKAVLSAHALANPREAHIGVAKVPDDRLDRLAALYNPRS
mgnify:CR=1 FL=1